MVKKCFSIPFLVSNVLAILFSFIGPMFHYRHTSTSYYGGSGHVSKGDWNGLSIFEGAPVLALFIFVVSVALIVFAIIFIAKRSDIPGKLAVATLIVLFAQVAIGIAVVFTPAGLSSSSTSGIAGAWSSSGETVELAGMGIMYLLCSAGSSLFGLASLLTRE